MFNLPPTSALTFHLIKKFIMDMSLSPRLSLVLARVLENSLPLSYAISTPPRYMQIFSKFQLYLLAKNATNTLQLSIHSD